LFLYFAATECASPGLEWTEATNESRARLVAAVISNSGKFFGFEVVRTYANGNIIVNFPPDLGANKRGTLLLDLEEYLKNEIDGGVVVWCDPLGDKSTLRNLRGIQIRS
jgi:hypothetical protein